MFGRFGLSGGGTYVELGSRVSTSRVKSDEFGTEEVVTIWEASWELHVEFSVGSDHLVNSPLSSIVTILEELEPCKRTQISRLYYE